jgi:replicative DNA helicase
MPKDRLVPQAREAEESVLGALLIDPHAKSDVVDLLPDGSLFWHAPHGLIYDALLATPAPDFVTVAAELTRRGKLEEAGGASYLVKLIEAVPTSVHARHYATMVERAYQLRRLAELPSKIMDTVYSEASDVDEVWARIRAFVDALQPQKADDACLEWADSLSRYLSIQMERAEETQSKQDGTLKNIAFPWNCLSRPGRIKRLRPGTLAVVAAESGRGKTSFAECCAESWAKAGYHVVFVHLELSHEVMLDRRAARFTGIPIDQLDAGVDLGAFSRYGSQLYNWPGTIAYLHAPGWTSARIVGAIEKRATRHQVDAVVIDYFTKMGYSRDNRYKLNAAQARGQQVEDCKNLAERLDIPILILSQFNRGGEIRDTGELEERCNYLIRITRDKTNPVADVSVEKTTFGPLFQTQMYFEGARWRWCDLSEQHHPGEVEE